MDTLQSDRDRATKNESYIRQKEVWCELLVHPVGLSRISCLKSKSRIDVTIANYNPSLFQTRPDEVLYVVQPVSMEKVYFSLAGQPPFGG